MKNGNEIKVKSQNLTLLVLLGLDAMMFERWGQVLTLYFISDAVYTHGMARPLRIEYPGAWYHVLNRGRRKEDIFFSEKDYEFFLKLLGECSKLFSLEVHAYSLMANHYHLLVRTPKGNLSRAMKHLNGVYAQRINHRHKFEGSLFKGRFKSIVIEEDSYFLELLRYIHRNPLKNGIVKDAAEHKWTSHRAYMNDDVCPTWLITGNGLLKFDKNKNLARKRFDAFVKKEVPKALDDTLDRVRWPAMLGGRSFREETRVMIKERDIDQKEVPQSKEVECKFSAEEIRDRIIDGLSWSKEVFQMHRVREQMNKRKAFVFVCRRDLQLSCGKIKSVLGDLSFAAITKYYKHACLDFDEKQGCSMEINMIRNILAKGNG